MAHTREELELELDSLMEEATDLDRINEILAELETLDDGETGVEDTATPAVPNQEVKPGSESESVASHAELSVGEESIDVSHIAPPVAEKPALIDESAQQLTAEQEQQVKDMEEKLALYENQLKENGLEPEKLDSELSLTQDEIDELKADLDELGVFGGVTYKLARMFQNLQKNAQTPQTPQEEVAVPDPIVEVAGLAQVMSDPQTRALAIQIDDALRVDAKWQNVPELERFKSVVAEVNRLQEEKKPAARTEDAKGENFVPNSIASAQTHQVEQQSVVEQFKGMTEEELVIAMENMTQAQIDEVLNNLGN